MENRSRSPSPMGAASTGWPETARVASGAERPRIWEQQKADYPGFADYEGRTTR